MARCLLFCCSVWDLFRSSLLCVLMYVLLGFGLRVILRVIVFWLWLIDFYLWLWLCCFCWLLIGLLVVGLCLCCLVCLRCGDWFGLMFVVICVAVLCVIWVVGCGCYTLVGWVVVYLLR